MKSYQNLCFFVLLISPVVVYCTDLFCDPRDEAVLLKIKSHFAPNHLLSESWDPEITCCEWNFVGCSVDPEFHLTRVTAVTFSIGTGISGDLPSLLGDLPYLTEIMFISEPNLTGPIPDSFVNLKYLQTILLSSNSLTGPIPDFLTKLKYLQEVDFSGNQLTGSIPSSLNHLHQLTQFNVSRNQLTGPVPTLPQNLTSFDISHNMLVGSIPSRLGQLRQLESVDVSYNRLCGPIPAGLNRFGATMFGHNRCLCGPPLPACN